MSIGIYSPYFDSLGGGERYLLTLAAYWSQTRNVSVFWNDPTILSKASERFNLDLRNVHVKPNIFVKGNYIRKLIASSHYDCIFFLSDGSVQTSFARVNVLHFQVPFAHISFPLWKRVLYKAFVCNSTFTKDHIDPRVRSRAVVVYPPVDVEKSKSLKKENIILSVGRFTPTKEQRILVTTFTEGYKKGYFHGWRLILAGGLLPSDKEYFKQLEVLAYEAPIELQPNIDYKFLSDAYARSRIYWHAAGYGQTNPENMEHFGITTVEAMAAGSIPVVVNAGGLSEIVTSGVDGYLWNTPDELIGYTQKLIKQIPNAMIENAKRKVMRFSVSEFTKAIDKALPFI
jgi:glycosyltransferase involved in cell wall biosynthesis